MSCNWSVKKLGDLVKFTSGGTPSKSNEAYWGGDIPWISASSMDSTRYSESELKVTTEGAKNGTRLVPKDTVLLLVRGGALHNKIPVGITTREVTFNQDVKALVPKTDEITPWYLLFWLISIKKTLLAKVENTGIGAGKLDTKILQELEVPLPPKPELQRLEKFCKALDDKIILNADTNQTLEQLAQAIFKSWFVDFDPVKAKMNGEQPEGMDAATASLFPEKLVESELGLIPEDWEVLPSEKVATVAIGKTPPRKEPQWFTENSEDVTWISIKDMGNAGTYALDSSEYLTQEAVDKFNVKIIPDNTLILSFKLTVGRVAITYGSMATNEAIAHYKLSDNARVSTNYLYSYMKQFNFESLGSTSSIAKAVNSKIIKALPVIVPSKAILESFDKLVQPLFGKIKSNQLENRSLEALRDTLLPKLLSGEIELNVISDDSPEVNVNLDAEEVDSFTKSLMKELKEEDKLSLIYDPFYLEPIVTWMENKDALPYSIVLKIEDALESLNRYIPRYYDDNGFSSEQDEIDENIQEFWGYGEPVCVREVTKYCMYMARKSYLQTMCSLLLSNTTPVTNNTLYALRISNLDVELMGCDISNWFGDILLVDAKAPYVTMKRDGESWILTFPEMGPRSDYSECVKAGYESIRHIIANAFACSVSVVEI